MARYTEVDREEAASLYIADELPFEEIVQVLGKRDPKRWATLSKKTLLAWASAEDAHHETWYTRRAKRVASLHRSNDLKLGKHQAKWVKRLTEMFEKYLDELADLTFSEHDKSGGTHAALAILRELRALTGIGVGPRAGTTIHIDQSDRRQILYLDIIVDAFCQHPEVGPVAQIHRAVILESIKQRILAAERGEEGDLAGLPPGRVIDVPAASEG